MSELPRVLLYFTGVDWPVFTRRPLIRALARATRPYGTTVIAVNRPLCPVTTVFRKPHRLGELLGRARLEQLDTNLYLYSPRYFLHDWIADRLPGLQAANLAALRYGYRHLLRRLGLAEPRPLIWFNYPQQGYVTDLFEGGFAIFEFYDYLSDTDGNQSPRLNRMEHELRDRVDLLLTPSRLLHEQYAPHYRWAIEFGNGMDRDTYDSLARDDISPLPEIAAIKSPRIGYAGMVEGRLDIDLIAALARAEPGYNFVFVGPQPSAALRERMGTYHNVHFLGPYPLEAMPAVLSGFDIGLLPYRDTPFFRVLNPLKFYEMAAAGLPMVASYLRQYEDTPDELVRILPNETEPWREAIRKQLAQDRNVTRRIGRALAARFLWDDMAASLLTAVAAAIDGKTPADSAS